MDAVSAKTCRRVGTSPALQQEGKGKHPGGAGEMHFSAYAGRSPPRPTNGAHRQSPPPEGLGPVQILLGVLLLFSPPCSPTFYFSTHCFPPALPLPPLGPGIPVDGWVGGWVDGRTLWPPSGSVRHPCKSLETTSWDWKLRLLLQGTKKRTKNKRMPKSHEARGYKSKLTAAQHLLLFGRLHDA